MNEILSLSNKATHLGLKVVTAVTKQMLLRGNNELESI